MLFVDRRKQVVISERSIKCERTESRITNRVEYSADGEVVEHVTIQSAESYLREVRAVLGVLA